MSTQQRATGVSERVRQQLMHLLARSGLPKKLVDRLLFDIDGGDHYSRVASIEELKTVPPNSSYWGTECACCFSTGVLVEQGKLGKLRIDDEYYFLAPGYHKFTTLGAEYLGETASAIYNTAVINGPSGFVTITEGHIGVLLVGAEYKLLAPGTYCWNSNSVRYQETVDVTKTIAKLGVFTVVTVPDGLVSVTYLNGDLRVLGHRENNSELAAAAANTTTNNNKSAPSEIVPGTSVTGQIQRTFFLDDPKWIHSTFLSTKIQTDRLEGLDVLSADNVEMLLVALGEWKIVDPVLAIKECADDMETIRSKVNALIRATISRIVAATAIGHNVSGASASDAQHHNNNSDGPDLSHLMQSTAAAAHMTELSKTLRKVGITVFSVYVPEKRMKNDDIRREIARQSVIGIKAEAERAASDAQAYAVVTDARAKSEAMRELAQSEAYATTVRAKAEAQAIESVSEAHASAGKRLGAPQETAARLALSEVVSKSFKDAKVTLFSGSPDKMPFMFTNEMK